LFLAGRNFCSDHVAGSEPVNRLAPHQVSPRKTVSREAGSLVRPAAVSPHIELQSSGRLLVAGVESGNSELGS
jgi:hypothetical protein